MLHNEEKDELTPPTQEENTSDVNPVENVESVPVDEIPDNDDQEEESDVTYRMDDDTESESEVDLRTLSKEELVDLVEKTIKEGELSAAAKLAQEVRVILDAMRQEEYDSALEAFIEAGNEKDNFEFRVDEFYRRFDAAFREIRQKRAEQRQRTEDEKLKNLAAKNRILDQLREITENNETEDSLAKVKELQSEWKKIRVVPRENIQELWDSYRVYLDKFYDNLSINFELKELDKKKNLEAKIELCKKVDALQEESSIKKAMIMLNKYHDEWKHTGPVPQEYSEEIWTRFKAASDKVYEQKKGELDKIREKRIHNFELKSALLEKLEQISTVQFNSPKEWIAQTQAIADLFEEWKKVGPVPKEHNDSIWSKFKELRNTFYRNKNAYFKSLNKEKNENLERKKQLCEKAEAIAKSDDWNKTTNELIRLQGEWKKVGPVPEGVSDEVWKRFRAACDMFFNKKEAHFSGQKEEQQQNLEAKKAIIEELKALAGNENADAVFKQLKDIQKRWAAAGFVPFKAKNQIQKEYSSLVDEFYKKFKRNADEMSEARAMEHYQELADMPDGDKKLQGEERRIREKIRFLKTEVETLENNIGFFSNSKTAGALIKGIQDKIQKANSQMERLNKELKAIKKLY